MIKPIKYIFPAAVLLFVFGVCANPVTTLPETDFIKYGSAEEGFIFPAGTKTVDIYNCLTQKMGIKANGGRQILSGTAVFPEGAANTDGFFQPEYPREIMEIEASYIKKQIHSGDVHTYTLVFYFKPIPETVPSLSGQVYLLDPAPTSDFNCGFSGRKDAVFTYRWRYQTINEVTNDKIPYTITINPAGA